MRSICHKFLRTALVNTSLQPNKNLIELYKKYFLN